MGCVTGMAGFARAEPRNSSHHGIQRKAAIMIRLVSSLISAPSASRYVLSTMMRRRNRLPLSDC